MFLRSAVLRAGRPQLPPVCLYGVSLHVRHMELALPAAIRAAADDDNAGMWFALR